MVAKDGHETRLRLANSQRAAIRFILEPWGREYVLRQDDEFVLVFHGLAISQPEVIFDEKRVEVWGWAGTTVEVFKNGEELAEYVPEEMPAVKPS